jgi:hypothetical protein
MNHRDIPYITSLYLDDMRTPRGNYYHNWIIVRSYQEFVDWIESNGLPEFITLDHDLCDEAIYADWNVVSYDDLTEKTGYCAARWLVDYCLDNNLNCPEFTVHSANPVGAENILCLLNAFRDTQGLSAMGYRTVW